MKSGVVGMRPIAERGRCSILCIVHRQLHVVHWNRPRSGKDAVVA